MFFQTSYWLKLNILVCLLSLSLIACQTSSLPAQWQWQRAEAGLSHQAIILSVAAEGNQIWAGYYGTGGLAVSQDAGQTWSTGAVGARDNPVFDLLVLPSDAANQPDELWAATRDGLFQSLDAGVTWQHLVEGLPPVSAFALASDGSGRLYVGLDGGEIYVQTKEPEGEQILTPLAVPLVKGEDRAKTEPPLAAILSLAASADGQQLYAGTSGHGILASNDGGRSWVKTYSGRYAPNIALKPDNPAVAIASLRNQVVRTQDGGVSWHTLPLAWAEEEVVSLLWLADGTLGAGTGQGNLYYSLDEGVTWFERGEDLPTQGSVLSLVVAPGTPPRLLAGTWNGLYASEDGGATWTNLAPTLGPLQAQTLLKTESSLLLGTRAALFRWQPEVAAWQLLPSHPPSGAASLAIHPQEERILYAGTSSNGIYRSDDGGVNWQPLPSLKKGIPALAIVPTRPERLYALAIWERVYESRDGGQRWAGRWEGLGNVIETTSLATDPTGPFVYVGTETGLFRIEGNEPWDLVAPELMDQSILSLLASQFQQRPVLYVGATRGLYRSFDRGNTFSQSWGKGLENLSVTALLLKPEDENHLFAGTAYTGVYQSLDGGETWNPIGPPDLEDEVVKAMAWGPGGELFIVTTNGVWRGSGALHNEP